MGLTITSPLPEHRLNEIMGSLLKASSERDERIANPLYLDGNRPNIFGGERFIELMTSYLAIMTAQMDKDIVTGSPDRDYGACSFPEWRNPDYNALNALNMLNDAKLVESTEYQRGDLKWHVTVLGYMVSKALQG